MSQMCVQYDCMELRAKKILKAFFEKVIPKMEYQDKVFLCNSRLNRIKETVKARKQSHGLRIQFLRKTHLVREIKAMRLACSVPHKTRKL